MHFPTSTNILIPGERTSQMICTKCNDEMDFVMDFVVESEWDYTESVQTYTTNKLYQCPRCKTIANSW